VTLDRKKVFLVTYDKLLLFQFSETKIHGNGDVRKLKINLIPVF